MKHQLKITSLIPLPGQHIVVPVPPFPAGEPADAASGLTAPSADPAAAPAPADAVAVSAADAATAAATTTKLHILHHGCTHESLHRSQLHVSGAWNGVASLVPNKAFS